MDTCLQSVECTLNDTTTSETRGPNKSQDDDLIFIKAQCEEQNVTLKYIFNKNSVFIVEDPEVNLTVQAFQDKRPKDAGPSDKDPIYC